MDVTRTEPRGIKTSIELLSFQPLQCRLQLDVFDLWQSYWAVRFVRRGVMLLVYAGPESYLLTTFQMSRNVPLAFIPDSDHRLPSSTIVQLPPGFQGLERTDKVVRQVNDIALNTPGVLHNWVNRWGST